MAALLWTARLGLVKKNWPSAFSRIRRSESDNVVLGRGNRHTVGIDQYEDAATTCGLTVEKAGHVVVHDTNRECSACIK